MLKHYILTFLAGGLVFGGLTYYLTSSGANTDQTPVAPEPVNSQVAQATSSIETPNHDLSSTATAPDSSYSNAQVIDEHSTAPPQDESSSYLVSISSDGRMYVNSETFTEVVNAENFVQRADEFVYGHSVAKTQEAYETEAELERLLFSDNHLFAQSFEVSYFKCSNDYCVLSVDADDEEHADDFFAHFANPDHQYANLIRGGGAFSILSSEDGAAARLVFGISELIR